MEKLMKKRLSALLLLAGVGTAGVAVAATDHSGHKMDHSAHGMKMDCSDPKHAQMAMCKKGMDHSQHKGMDHSKMNHGQKKAMDHSQHKGMDHSKMNHGQKKAMDHSQHKGMDHSKMDHGQHAANAIPVSDGSATEDIPMPFPGAMHMVDDPFLSKFIIDRFEIIDSDEDDKPILLEAEAWFGKDIDKLWIKAEVEREGSLTEEAEFQFLYSRAISPYWDFQVGIRKDLKPVDQEWFALGFKGVAPYYFDVDASVFFGKGGKTAASLSGEYELMLTQKTAVVPELELNFFGQDDPAAGVGSGLSDMNFSLRLQHEFRREFAPYFGVTWTKLFGSTADYARDEGEDTSDARFMVGVHAWF